MSQKPKQNEIFKTNLQDCFLTKSVGSSIYNHSMTDAQTPTQALVEAEQYCKL